MVEIVKKNKKVKNGKVVKISGHQTVSVQVSGLKRHPLYRKVVRVTSKYLVHDENCSAKVGDTVSIIEVRPLSKMKRWRILSLLSTSSENSLQESEKA